MVFCCRWQSRSVLSNLDPLYWTPENTGPGLPPRDLRYGRILPESVKYFYIYL